MDYKQEKRGSDATGEQKEMKETVKENGGSKRRNKSREEVHSAYGYAHELFRACHAVLPMAAQFT